jgi:hypothetical protein
MAGQVEPLPSDTLASICEGNAARHFARWREPDESEQDRLSQDAMLAASGFAVAGSLWSLTEPRRAAECYLRAAKLYRRLGHSYWIVLTLASGSRRELPSILRTVDEAPPLDPQGTAFALIANELQNNNNDDDRHELRAEHLRGIWRHFGDVPIGRLGIPLDFYAHCASAMRVARLEKNSGQFVAALTAYMGRASEVIRAARHDRFHWDRMISTLLPAEPEAIAMTTAMSEVSHSVFEKRLVELNGFGEDGARLAEIGDKMQDAEDDEGERVRS